MIGFGFSVFTQAILGLGGGFRGSALNLDFTSGNRTLDPRVTFSRTTNATLTNSAGLVANAPMNLLTFSEQFDNAAWNPSDVLVTANSVASPNGTTTADTVNEGATNSLHRLQQVGFSYTSGLAYTQSVFAKADTATVVQMLFLSTAFGVNAFANFDLSTGTLGTVADSATATITAVGNGWYRCTLTATASSTASGNGGFIFLCNNNTSAVRAPSYTGTNKQFYIWGAQLELGSTATTYNPTTVKNLLGYTEHFDNAAWTKSNASISATKVDDIYGQPFAQKLVEDANNTTHFTRTAALTLGFPATFSCYMKAGERSWGYLQLSGSGSLAYFDLNSGVVGTTIGGTAEISSVGAGWYRCSLTDTTTTTAFAIIGVTNANGSLSYTGDGTSGIYIFGAQLSDSASVDPYVYNPVAAPSSVAYYGPRFDYDPVTLAPKGLLIEEQRTNLLLNSAAIGSTYWSNGRTISFLNSAVAPDGTSTATKVAGDPTQAGNKRVFEVSTTVVSSVYTASVYAKAGEITSVKIAFSTSVESEYASAIFNLSDGTVTTGARGAITPVGDDWYRCSVFGTATSTASAAYIYPIVEGTAGFTGDGVSGVYLWGAQLEAGAFATSYIPTVASQVTRAADSASMIGNNFARWYTQGSGTIFSQFDTPASGNRPVVSIDDNTANNMIRLRTEATDPYFRVVTGGAAQADLDVGTVAANTVYKMAGGFGSNSFLSCINAGTVGSDTSGTVPIVDRLRIGSDQAGAYLNGHIARTSYYGRVLTATEDQGITQ